MSTDANMITVTTSEAAQIAKTCIKAKQPVCFWGDPGIGKSDLGLALEQDPDLAFESGIDLRGAQLDAVDTRGLPFIVNGETAWTKPNFLPTKGRHLIKLEELNRAPHLVQSALLGLVRERRLGDYMLSPDAAIIAMCNYEKSAGTFKMSDAMLGRFVHINIRVDLDAWRRWALKNKIHPSVIGFLTWRSEHLHRFDPKSHANPAPRTWEFVSRLQYQFDADKTPTTSPLVVAPISGAVGRGTAMEYIEYLGVFTRLPNLDALVANPDTTPVPTGDVSALYAISCALERKADVTNFDRIVRYAVRMPGEFQLLAINGAILRDPALAHEAGYTAWWLEQGQKLLAV